MDKIVIGVHGLQNKPAQNILTQWWKASMEEGFQVIHRSVPCFALEMAYWAHHFHPQCQRMDVADVKSPAHLPEPYVPGTYFGPRAPQPIQQKIAAELQKQMVHLFAGESGFMNRQAIKDLILHRMFIELDMYYNHNLTNPMGREVLAKDLIRNELVGLLKKHRKRKILLVAHSMGTIVAYDVLLNCVPDIPVHTFVTLGSPLGFPVIMCQVRKELGLDVRSEARLPTPPNIVGHWLNFSDLEDVTCLNYNLRNNYAENERGVRPFDQIVYNNYEYLGRKNPHKVYGYLRTADFTLALHMFLNTMEGAGFFQRLKWAFTGK